MKLVKLHMSGFRGFAEKTSVEFDDLTVFVGKNDSGKSSILDALNIFFGEGKMDEGDVNVQIQKTDSPTIEISCEFTDYPDELIIDETNKVSPVKEYLLNASGNFHIRKEYTGKTLTSKTYLVANHPKGENIQDLLELSMPQLKSRAEDMNVDLSNFDRRKKSDIRHAIWGKNNAEERLEEQSIMIGSKGKGDFKSIEEQLQEHMPVFALFKSDRPNIDQDSEAQDPLKSAVKEIINQRKQELDKIASAIKTELQGVADKTVEKIRELDPKIADRLTPNVADPAWDKVFKISLTGEDEVPVNKRGSGFRRLVLLSFFRAKAEEKSEIGNIIYAIEEPETSQHPNYQRMLLKAFEELAEGEGRQVFVTTHTPVLAEFIPIKQLRYVKFDKGNRSVINKLSDQEMTEIADSLGVLPDNKVKLFLLVEGENDISFLRNIAGLYGINLRKEEKKGTLIFISMGGKKNLKLWVSRLSKLNKKEICIYDRDDANSKVKGTNENQTIFRTEKKEMENYIHPDAINEIYSEQDLKIEKADVQSDTDVPHLILKNLDGKSNERMVKRKLNNEAAKKMTEERLRAMDGWDEIGKWMTAIKKALHNGN